VYARVLTLFQGRHRTQSSRGFYVVAQTAPCVGCGSAAPRLVRIVPAEVPVNARSREAPS
jgi:hypothetical protein